VSVRKLPQRGDICKAHRFLCSCFFSPTRHLQYNDITSIAVGAFSGPTRMTILWACLCVCVCISWCVAHKAHRFLCTCSIPQGPRRQSDHINRRRSVVQHHQPELPVSFRKLPQEYARDKREGCARVIGLMLILARYLQNNLITSIQLGALSSLTGLVDM
jgi:hypothetical protein